MSTDAEKDRFYENYEQIRQFVIDGTLLDGDALLGLCDLFYNYKTLKVVKTTIDKEKCIELLANKQANLEVKKQALKQCKQKARELAKYLIFLHLSYKERLDKIDLYNSNEIKEYVYLDRNDLDCLKSSIKMQQSGKEMNHADTNMQMLDLEKSLKE